MTHTPRAIVAVGCLAAALALAAPADAQFFGQPSDLPIGEAYHVEVLGGMWNPTPALTISSEEFGIAGTNIDFTSDLGISAKRFGEIRVRLRPGRKHRFRIDYLPIRYAAQSVVERRLVFRGIAYDVGVPGQFDDHLEHLATRLRVRHRAPLPRVLRAHRRGEVHRG